MSLVALRTAGQAATPAPWSSRLSGDAAYLDAEVDGRQRGLLAGIHAKEWPNDAAFCALARNSWDALIDVVEEARAALPELAKTYGSDRGMALQQAIADLEKVVREAVLA